MVREVPLNQFWESLGATLKTEQDWKIPSLFKDFRSEHEAVRKAVGLIDHSFRGKVEITGSDRTAFLHNILSHDIKNRGLGTGCYATLLSAAGKVLADMNVYVFANSILLNVEMGLEKKLLDLLGKYLVSEDVKIKDVTEKYGLISLQGPRSEALAQALFQGPFPELSECQHANFHIGEANVTLIRQSRTGEKGYHLLIPSQEAREVADRVMVVGKLYGLRPVGFGTAEILRIEAGILRYGIDMDENVSLPETGLDEIAASSTKGCYPGQEVVARTKTYGAFIEGCRALSSRRAPCPGQETKYSPLRRQNQTPKNRKSGGLQVRASRLLCRRESHWGISRRVTLRGKNR